MSDKHDGGPAYPVAFTTTPLQGMSLRDAMAIAAMQGMLAYPGCEMCGSHHNNNTYEGVASMAYEYADAMLKERSK